MLAGFGWLGRYFHREPDDLWSGHAHGNKSFKLHVNTNRFINDCRNLCGFRACVRNARGLATWIASCCVDVVASCSSPSKRVLLVLLCVVGALVLMAAAPWKHVGTLGAGHGGFGTHFTLFRMFYGSKPTYDSHTLVEAELDRACHGKKVSFLTSVASQGMPLSVLVHSLRAEGRKLEAVGACTRVVIFDVDEVPGRNTEFTSFARAEEGREDWDHVSFVDDRSGMWSPDELDGDMNPRDPAMAERKRLRDFVWVLRAMACFEGVNAVLFLDEHVAPCQDALVNLQAAVKSAAWVNSRWKSIRAAPGTVGLVLNREVLTDLADFLESNIHQRMMDDSVEQWLHEHQDAHFVTRHPLFHTDLYNCTATMDTTLDWVKDWEAFPEEECEGELVYPCAPGQRYPWFIENLIQWRDSINRRISTGSKNPKH